MLPYGVIVPLAAAVFAVRYARIGAASRRSKGIVGGVAVAAVVTYWFLPAWQLAAILLSVGLGVYVTIYLTVAADSRPASSGVHPRRVFVAQKTRRG
jgi:hypothetical protein